MRELVFNAGIDRPPKARGRWRSAERARSHQSPGHHHATLSESGTQPTTRSSWAGRRQTLPACPGGRGWNRRTGRGERGWKRGTARELRGNGVGTRRRTRARGRSACARPWGVARARRGGRGVLPCHGSDLGAFRCVAQQPPVVGPARHGEWSPVRAGACGPRPTRAWAAGHLADSTRLRDTRASAFRGRARAPVPSPSFGRFLARPRDDAHGCGKTMARVGLARERQNEGPAAG